MKNETTLTVPRENARHGSINLPVNSYHCFIPETYTELAPHWHEEMEITLVRKGTSDYRIGQSIFHAEEGDILLIPPYCIHSASEIPGETMLTDSLVFHLDYLGARSQDISAARYMRPMADGYFQMPERIKAGDTGYVEIKETFLRSLDFFLSRPAFFEIGLKAELLNLILLLFKNGYVRETKEGWDAAESRQQIKAVLQYISEHYREKIRISDLARLAGFSESYLMSLFRQYVGMSCIQYIIHFRIQEAARALEETSSSVAVIALDHGFDNISYFNLQFRKYFGMTPREFRRKQAH
ncbi:MAG: helix-turn-helix transcriptional regulator [Blautia sp.]|nr:helix-turn-helix transcriptional regulator [Blautia sp.]